MAQAVRIRLFTMTSHVVSHVIYGIYVRGSENEAAFYFVRDFVLFLVTVIRSVLHNHVYSTDGNNLKLDSTLNP